MTKKLEFINLLEDCLEAQDFEKLCMSEDEIKQYHDGSRDPFVIFEGDPDYMVDENGNTVYFAILGDTVYYIDCEGNGENLDKLMEFCGGQDPTVPRSGYNTRSETKSREYFDKNTRESRDDYNGLKIAYRGGCGYVYTLFKYV